MRLSYMFRQQYCLLSEISQLCLGELGKTGVYHPPQWLMPSLTFLLRAIRTQILKLT